MIVNKAGDNPKKLLWLDMEFTGLNPLEDVITEAAVIVTDFDMREQALYESGIKHDESTLRAKLAANPFYSEEMPAEHTESIVASSQRGKQLEDVEKDLLDLIAGHWSGNEGVILAGNSIHSDRAFIRAYMPKLEQSLHYRMLDVSSLKVYMQGKYGQKYVKNNTHRALDDIRESIQELEHYADLLKEPQ